MSSEYRLADWEYQLNAAQKVLAECGKNPTPFPEDSFVFLQNSPLTLMQQVRYLEKQILRYYKWQSNTLLPEVPGYSFAFIPPFHPDITLEKAEEELQSIPSETKIEKPVKHRELPLGNHPVVLVQFSPENPEAIVPWRHPHKPTDIICFLDLHPNVQNKLATGTIIDIASPQENVTFARRAIIISANGKRRLPDYLLLVKAPDATTQLFTPERKFVGVPELTPYSQSIFLTGEEVLQAFKTNEHQVQILKRLLSGEAVPIKQTGTIKTNGLRIPA